jgi:hypothetical protein
LQGGVAHAAHAHMDEGLFDVAGFQLVDVQHPQEQLEIGCDPVAEVVESEAFVVFFFQVKSRVSRHKAHGKFAGVKMLGGIIADDLAGIVGLHIDHIAVDAVGIVFFKGLGDDRQHAGMGKKVVGIQDADHVSAGGLDAFVDGVVEALVGLGDDPGDVGVFPTILRVSSVDPPSTTMCSTWGCSWLATLWSVSRRVAAEL